MPARGASQGSAPPDRVAASRTVAAGRAPDRRSINAMRPIGTGRPCARRSASPPNDIACRTRRRLPQPASDSVGDCVGRTRSGIGSEREPRQVGGKHPPVEDSGPIRRYQFAPPPPAPCNSTSGRPPPVRGWMHARCLSGALRSASPARQSGLAATSGSSQVPKRAATAPFDTVAAAPSRVAGMSISLTAGWFLSLTETAPNQDLALLPREGFSSCS